MPLSPSSVWVHTDISLRRQPMGHRSRSARARTFRGFSILASTLRSSPRISRNSQVSSPWLSP